MVEWGMARRHSIHSAVSARVEIFDFAKLLPLSLPIWRIRRHAVAAGAVLVQKKLVMQIRRDVPETFNSTKANDHGRASTADELWRPMWAFCRIAIAEEAGEENGGPENSLGRLHAAKRLKETAHCLLEETFYLYL
jgi:hypothetical protein